MTAWLYNPEWLEVDLWNGYIAICAKHSEFSVPNRYVHSIVIVTIIIM